MLNQKQRAAVLVGNGPNMIKGRVITTYFIDIVKYYLQWIPAMRSPLERIRCNDDPDSSRYNLKLELERL